MKRPELVSRDRRTRSRREKLFGVEALSVICGGMKTLEQHLIVRLPRQAVTCQLPEYFQLSGEINNFTDVFFPGEVLGANRTAFRELAAERI